MNDKIARIGILPVVAILLATFPSALAQQSAVLYTNDDRDKAITSVTWCFI